MMAEIRDTHQHHCLLFSLVWSLLVTILSKKANLCSGSEQEGSLVELGGGSFPIVEVLRADRRFTGANVIHSQAEPHIPCSAKPMLQSHRTLWYLMSPQENSVSGVLYSRETAESWSQVAPNGLLSLLGLQERWHSPFTDQADLTQSTSLHGMINQ